MDPATSGPAILLFDGTCGICTRTAYWLRAHDPGRRILVRPNQMPGLIDRYGLSREQVDRSAWLIEADGTRHEGAAAVNRMGHIIGGRWAWLVAPYALPPVRWVEERLYRWIADNRHRLARWGVTPECEQPGGRCG